MSVTFRKAVPSDLCLGAIVYQTFGSYSGSVRGRSYFVPATVTAMQVAAVAPSGRSFKFRSWIAYDATTKPHTYGHWSATLSGGRGGWYRFSDWFCQILTVEVQS